MKVKRFIKYLIAGTATLGAGLLLTGCFETKINLNDYLEVEVSGYDTVGTASYSIDYEKMIKDNPKAFGLDKEPKDEDLVAVGLRLMGLVEGDLDKDEGLSNGDKITFTWDEIDKDDVDYKVKFKSDPYETTVEDLKEAEVYDPFESDITVSFSGVSPNGQIEVKNNSELSIDCDKQSGLKNGDVVTVEVISPYGGEVNEYLAEKGKIVKETTKQFTVEGLSSYAAKYDEIPEDMQQKLKKQAEDTFKSQAANWDNENSIKVMEPLGYYFLTGKEGFEVSPNNTLYLVYKITVNMKGFASADAEEETTGEDSYYTYFRYDDIMILEDGTCSVDLSSGYACENTCDSSWGYDSFWVGKQAYEFRGYKDLESMFSDAVTSKIGEYDYDNTVEDATEPATEKPTEKPTEKEKTTENKEESKAEE